MSRLLCAALCVAFLVCLPAPRADAEKQPFPEKIREVMVQIHRVHRDPISELALHNRSDLSQSDGWQVQYGKWHVDQAYLKHGADSFSLF